MTKLTEQEVCIGNLGTTKVYLHWSDVKDICTNAVSEAYEQMRKENSTLVYLLKTCAELMDNTNVMNTNIDVYMQRKKDVLNAINHILGEK